MWKVIILHGGVKWMIIFLCFDDAHQSYNKCLIALPYVSMIICIRICVGIGSRLSNYPSLLLFFPRSAIPLSIISLHSFLHHLPSPFISLPSYFIFLPPSYAIPLSSCISLPSLLASAISAISKNCKSFDFHYDLGNMSSYGGYRSYLGFFLCKFNKLGVQNARKPLLY